MDISSRARESYKRQLSFKVNAKITAAGLALVANNTGRVLMLQRSLSEGDPASGRWEFPGGRLEPGEAPFDAAMREWSEETGLNLPLNAKIQGDWIAPNGRYQLFIYRIPQESDIELNLDHEDRHVSNPDDPDGDEIEVIAWWSLEDLPTNPALRDEVKNTDWRIFQNTITAANSCHAPDTGRFCGGSNYPTIDQVKSEFGTITPNKDNKVPQGKYYVTPKGEWIPVQFHGQPIEAKFTQPNPSKINPIFTFMEKTGLARVNITKDELNISIARKLTSDQVDALFPNKKSRVFIDVDTPYASKNSEALFEPSTDDLIELLDNIHAAAYIDTLYELFEFAVGPCCRPQGGGTGCGNPDCKAGWQAKEKEILENADPRVRAHLEHMLTGRREVEPKYTDLLSGIVKQYSGKMLGLGFKFKDAQGIANKIERKVVEKGITHEQSAENIVDALRYTVAISPDNYVDGMKSAVKALTRSGDVEFESFENNWQPGDAYNGVNAVFQDKKTGLKIELQFHTPESFIVKDKVNHKNYELIRERKGTALERFQAFMSMKAKSDAIQFPEGITDLEGFGIPIKSVFRPFNEPIAIAAAGTPISKVLNWNEAERLSANGTMTQGDWEDFVDNALGYGGGFELLPNKKNTVKLQSSTVEFANPCHAPDSGRFCEGGGIEKFTGKLPIDIIKPSMKYLADRPNNSQKKLEDDIRKVGVLKPIDIVYESINGKLGYYIRDGHHRWAAAKAVGLTEIPVKIESKVGLPPALTAAIEFANPCHAPDTGRFCETDGPAFPSQDIQRPFNPKPPKNYHQESTEWIAKLTPEEQDAAIAYTGSYLYGEINKAAVAGGSDPRVAALDSALEKAGVRDTAIRVYRRVGFPSKGDTNEGRDAYMANVKIGEEISLGVPGSFISTSITPRYPVTTSWITGTVIFEINTRSGAAIGNVTQGGGTARELEVLIPRDARYRVVGIQEEVQFGPPPNHRNYGDTGKRLVVQVEEII